MTYGMGLTSWVRCFGRTVTFRGKSCWVGWVRVSVKVWMRFKVMARVGVGVRDKVRLTDSVRVKV